MPKDVLDQLGSLTLEKDHFLVNINTYSKLAPEVWPDYVSDMLSGAPQDVRRAVRVTLKTSWFMRMRLCEVMGRAVHARALDVLGALVGTEVDAARKLAHDEDIHPVELLGIVVDCIPLPHRTARPNLGNTRVQPNPLGGGGVNLLGDPVDVLGEEVETPALLIKVGLHEMFLVRTTIAQGVDNGDMLFEIRSTCTRIVWHTAIALVANGLPDSRLKSFYKKVTPDIER